MMQSCAGAPKRKTKDFARFAVAFVAGRTMGWPISPLPLSRRKLLDITPVLVTLFKSISNFFCVRNHRLES